MKHASSLFVFITFLSIAPLAHAETIVSSHITEDTTWTAENSPYIIQFPSTNAFIYAPIVVQAGATLTIEPGVIVKSDSYNGLFVEGELRALGTETQPVLFTSLSDTAAQEWMHIAFGAGSHGTLQHIEVRYGGQEQSSIPFTAIRNEGGILALDHVTMRDNGNDGYAQTAGSATIAHSDIHDHSIGISMSGGTLSVSDMRIHDNDTGVSHENGDLVIADSEIANNSTGFLVEYEGSVTIGTSSIHANDTGIRNESEFSEYVGDDEFGNPIFSNHPAVPIDSRNNWWGSSTGPTDEENNPGGTGDWISGPSIQYVPFLTSDPFAVPPTPATPGEAAADLAKQLINEPYLWGGKGWDMLDREFVSVDRIKTGYNYWNPDANGGSGGVDIGSGLDCSGLVGWSYNRNADPNAYFTNNFIKFESADMQKKYNSQPIAESELQAGDLLYFDWEQDGRIDHVAMYVGGGDGNNIVHAANVNQGIIPASKNTLSNEVGFEGFSRPTGTTIAMAVAAQSPVHLNVTDPDGNIIDNTTVISSEEEYIREAPGDLVYTVVGVGNDGHPQEMVYSPILKEGEYRVGVAPISGVATTETFSLKFTTKDQTMSLAEDVPVAKIPETGYQVVVDDEEVILARTISASADSYIKQGTPNKNQGTENILRVRAAGDNRALVQFDLSEIPDGAAIVSAKMVFTIADNKDNWGKKDGRTIGVYRLKKSWTESGATWNCGADTNTANSSGRDCNGTAWEMGKPNKPELWPYAAAPTAVANIANGQLGEMEFDVTSDVQNIVSGAVSNDGWLIRKEKEGASGWVDFASKETANGPRLIITYR